MVDDYTNGRISLSSLKNQLAQTDLKVTEKNNTIIFTNNGKSYNITSNQATPSSSNGLIIEQNNPPTTPVEPMDPNIVSMDTIDGLITFYDFRQITTDEFLDELINRGVYYKLTHTQVSFKYNNKEYKVPLHNDNKNSANIYGFGGKQCCTVIQKCIEKFATGNMTYSELRETLAKIKDMDPDNSMKVRLTMLSDPQKTRFGEKTTGLKGGQTIPQADNTVKVKITFADREVYEVTCSKDAAASSNDNKTKALYNPETLLAIASEEDLKEFFYVAVQHDRGVGNKVEKYAPINANSYQEFIARYDSSVIERAINAFIGGYKSTTDMYAMLQKSRIVTDLVQTETDNGKIKFTFKLKGIPYEVSCNKEAAESDRDNKYAKTYDAQTLIEYTSNNGRYSANLINEYFEPVLTINGNVKSYVLKDEKDYNHFAAELLKRVENNEATINNNGGVLSFKAEDDTWSGPYADYQTKKLYSKDMCLDKCVNGVNKYLNKSVKPELYSQFISNYGSALEGAGQNPEIIFNQMYNTALALATADGNWYTIARTDPSSIFSTHGGYWTAEVDTKPLIDNLLENFNSLSKQYVSDTRVQLKYGITDHSIRQSIINSKGSCSSEEFQITKSLMLSSIKSIDTIISDEDKLNEFMQFLAESDETFNLDNFADLFTSYYDEDSANDFGSMLVISTIFNTLVTKLCQSEDENTQAEFLDNNKLSFKELMSNQEPTTKSNGPTLRSTKSNIKFDSTGFCASAATDVALGLAKVLDFVSDVSVMGGPGGALISIFADIASASLAAGGLQNLNTEGWIDLGINIVLDLLALVPGGKILAKLGKKEIGKLVKKCLPKLISYVTNSLTIANTNLDVGSIGNININGNGRGTGGGGTGSGGGGGTGDGGGGAIDTSGIVNWKWQGGNAWSGTGNLYEGAYEYGGQLHLTDRNGNTISFDKVN